MDLSYFKNKNTLNIFCDASIENLDNGKFRGCYGALAVYGDQPIDEIYKVCNNTSNNDAEIKAIRSAIILAAKYKTRFQNINILSDSQISIYGIRDRIFNWRMINETLYGSSNNPIANQSIFLEIVNIIVSKQLRIKFYHQKGHVSSSIKSRFHAKEVFMRSNSIDSVSDDLIKYISYWNNVVDNESRTLLYNLYLINSNNEPINFIASNEFQNQLIKYKQLIQ